jgi:hypothetical protein
VPYRVSPSADISNDVCIPLLPERSILIPGCIVQLRTVG